MSIALLCPTRGRVDKFKRMLDTVVSTAESNDNFVTLAYVTPDDACIRNYGLAAMRSGKLVEGHDFPTCHKWNLLAQIAMQNTDIKLFMLGADDMEFSTPLWDRALLDHYGALKNKIHVYHFQDSRDPEGTPHPIVTREYIEAMGYFLPPLFLHWYVDSWTVQMAKKNGCFTHMKDYLLIHNKPSDRGKADETHNRIRALGWHERDTWVNDRCQHILEAETKRLYQAICNQVDVVEC